MIRLLGLPVAALLVLLSACGGGDGDDRAAARADSVAAAAAQSDSAGEASPRLVSYTVRGVTSEEAVERVLRSPDRVASELEGDSVGVLFTLEGVIASDGRVRTLAVRPGEADTTFAPGGRTAIHFEGGVVTREVPAGDSVVTDTLSVPEGTVPWLPESVALVEQVALRARALGEDTVTVPLLDVRSGSGAVRRAAVTWDSPVSVTFRVEPDEQIRLSFDEDGRVSRMENLRRTVTAIRRR